MLVKGHEHRLERWEHELDARQVEVCVEAQLEEGRGCRSAVIEDDPINAFRG